MFASTGSRVVRIHPVLRMWLEHFWQASGPIAEGWANIGRDLPAACARAGVPRCPADDLRRTFASWLVQQGVAAIPRTSRLERLSENIEIFDFELSDEDMQEISSMAPAAG